MNDPKPDKTRKIAVRIASRISVVEKEALIRWIDCLLELKTSNLPALQKAKNAISLTATSNVVATTAKTIAREVKRLGWDDRSLTARLGMGAAATGAAFFGGQGAGVAALGAAVGIPLWVIFGAGGAFMGVLYEELTGKRRNTKTSYQVIDAERTDNRPDAS